jgi:hypothetical protein
MEKKTVVITMNSDRTHSWLSKDCDKMVTNSKKCGHEARRTARTIDYEIEG